MSIALNHYNFLLLLNRGEDRSMSWPNYNPRCYKDKPEVNRSANTARTNSRNYFRAITNQDLLREQSSP